LFAAEKRVGGYFFAEFVGRLGEVYCDKDRKSNE
jgi:hypothetical protein